MQKNSVLETNIYMRRLDAFVKSKQTLLKIKIFVLYGYLDRDNNLKEK